MKEFMSPENSCRQRPSSNNHEDRSPQSFSPKKPHFLKTATLLPFT
jgi:hypothetical protein